MMECHVCLDAFDATKRRPKVLPCGHTFCLRCLQGLQPRRCPLDQKVFESAPGKLPDNYMLLQVSTKPAERPAFHLWCKTCKKEAVAVCADEHVVCSFKKARTEEAAPLLEELQRGQAGLKQLRQTLNTAAQSLDLASSRSELDKAEFRLGLVKEGLERAKGEDAAKWTEAKQDAVPCDMSRGAAQLVADLANPSFKVTVQLGEAGGVAWSSEVRPVESAAARLLLCQLACLGGLQQQGQPPGEQQQQGQLQVGVEEPCLSTSGKILDVSLESSERDIKAMTNVTARSDLAEVRCLLGLDCCPSPPWSHNLLERVAPNLEGLEMVTPEQRHLDVVLAMPRLQALSITGVKGNQLRQVAQTASLRRLQVQCNISSQLPVQELPATRLQWLRCEVYPLAAALALVRASAETLEELQLVAASKEPYGCPDLAAELRRCGLKKLKKLVLLRDWGACYRDAYLCRHQRVALCNMFLDDGMNVAVTCSVCARDESSVCVNARPAFLGETRFA